MPEGDVVWRTAQRLNAALASDELTGSDLRWPSLATVDLSRRSVLEVVSRGKHLLMRLSSGSDAKSARDGAVPLTLHSHLRMEGSWSLHRTGARATAPRSASGVRAVLATARWTAVGHKLGMLDLVATEREADLIGHLGPDPLGRDWDADEVVAAVLAQPTRPLGEVLLDQRVLAGVGTFYMSEALFLRGTTPWTPSGDLDQSSATALVDLLRRLLQANSVRGVQITTGQDRPGRRNWVHARSGRPCLRCGTTVRVASLGSAPQDRVAFYCPHCQSGPRPREDGRPPAPLGARRRRGGHDGR